MTKTVQRVACKTVIAYKGKVLILREAVTYQDGTNIGKYGLPGGRIEPGEPYAVGLAREVQEETGLTVTIGEPVYVGEWSPVIQGVSHHIVAIFFACEAEGDAVSLSEEHDSYAWIDPADVDQYNFMSPDADVIKTYAKRFL